MACSDYHPEILIVHSHINHIIHSCMHALKQMKNNLKKNEWEFQTDGLLNLKLNRNKNMLTSILLMCVSQKWRQLLSPKSCYVQNVYQEKLGFKIF